MTKYRYLDHLLGNYFAGPIGHSEEQAVAALRKAMTESEVFAGGVSQDVRKALVDDSVRWRELLSKHEVVHFEDEVQAQRYACELLGRLL